MQVDLSSFAKAIASLERAILRSSAAAGDEELRDAVIQRFEFTYELAWKSLRRVLAASEPNSADIAELSYRELIRLGAERGLIDDPSLWFGFREERNISSHTYDADKAAEVYTAALALAPAAKNLLSRLEARS